MFESPSELFRWCLINTKSGSKVFSYEICFSQYIAIANSGEYLWKNYDSRLGPVIKAANKGGRILEVGCGFGHDLAWAATRGGRAVGIDVSSDFVAISKLTQRNIEEFLGYKLDISIHRTSVLDMDNSEKFDLIYMKDVFHHLEPRSDVVKKLGDLLAPGGQLIIIEPNALNPLIQLQMYRIRGFKTIIEKTDSVTGERYLFGNERLVSGRSLISSFQHVGIEGTINYMRLLPTRLVSNKKYVCAARLLENLGVERILPPLCIHTIYVGYKYF